MTEPGRQSREMSAFDAQNELAGKWMKRGIALLEENTRASLNDSVPCFEMAIRLRSALPLEIKHRFRYGLAAGWMNRGDALTRLGSPENFSEALRSYDEALGQLRVLPIDENPLFRKRLAVAWLNRGITLQQQGKDFSEAVRSFEESVALLAVEQAADIPDQKQLLGCAWMNRGNGLLQLQKPDAREACKSARQALEILAATERADVISAEAGLKARHVLCRAIALLMAEPGLKELDAKELVIEATDAVDDAMKLEREWELRNVTRFRALAGELFRFGVRAYQIHQPQFLVEFILESLDPKESPGASANAEMHIEAVRSLWGSLREFEKEGFRNPAGSARFEQLLQKLEELSFAENRLEELRRELQLANARVVSDR